MLFFLLDRTLGPALGWLQTPAEIGGSVTCGLTWLLTRMLFRPSSDRAAWPWYLIAAQFFTAAIIVVARPANGTGFDLLLSAVKNINLLIGPTALVLTLLEPLVSLGQVSAQPERRFRWIYVAGYGVLVTLAVLLDSSSAATATMIKVCCATAALILSGAAVWYRVTHPLPETSADRKRRAPEVTPDIDRLRKRILAILEDRELYRNPELKVADIARRIGEPAYKISQSTNGLRGFQNFNQLINAYRIDAATRRLAEPGSDDQSILKIALDCGFASIGPFNRAFKERTGMTPTRFRQMRSRAGPDDAARA
jgi:AraC-like DNA-binding protein